MMTKLQSLKGKTKLKFSKKISEFYNKMRIRRQNGNSQLAEDPFSKGAQCNSKIYTEVLFLMKFLQTNPQIKNMNIKFYDLYYTVMKDGDEKEIINDECENIENDYNKNDDYITPNHYIGRKNNHEILK